MSRTQNRTIAFVNQKGGVGKTSAAVTIAHGLARAGRRVLLVDLDPQGHVARLLDLEKEPGIHQLLTGEAQLHELLREARPGLEILPSDKMTATLSGPELFGRLRQALANAGHDVILFDLAPGLSSLHMAALQVADVVIIPVTLDFLAIDSVNEVSRTLHTVATHGHPFAGGVYVAPMFFDRVTSETQKRYNDLQEAFGARVWPPIPSDTKAREAAAAGETVWEYCPTSAVVAGYGAKGPPAGYNLVLQRIEELL